MRHKSVIVVGGGLAGLSCAFELVQNSADVTVVESRDVMGGRTSSWVEDGMPVESGLHKFLGTYRALPRLLEGAGVGTDDVVTWVDELAIYDPGTAAARFTVSPYHRPIRTAVSVFGNNEYIPPADKAKLMAMGTAGLARCVSDPLGFDKVSVAEYAAEFGISGETIRRLLSTSTQAVLFLPADRFSAYAAFAPVVESVKNMLTARIGAFQGGMTEVMIQPIVKAIIERGGAVRCSTTVSSLLTESGRVVGVRIDNEELRADAVVLAVPLKAAQELIRAALENGLSFRRPWFEPMLGLPSLSAATIQFELDEPLLSSDRTNFSSTAMCCFADQSRTTFTDVAGRFSAILYPPWEFINKPPEQVFDETCNAASQIGIPLREHVTRYRIVNHPHDFYAMEPGTEPLRPTQDTPVYGLFLCGDYTKQPFVASMEGAVLSGQAAARAMLD